LQGKDRKISSQPLQTDQKQNKISLKEFKKAHAAIFMQGLDYTPSFKSLEKEKRHKSAQ